MNNYALNFVDYIFIQIFTFSRQLIQQHIITNIGKKNLKKALATHYIKYWPKNTSKKLLKQHLKVKYWQKEPQESFSNTL